VRASDWRSQVLSIDTRKLGRIVGRTPLLPLEERLADGAKLDGRIRENLERPASYVE
jgi:hypothetical protein